MSSLHNQNILASSSCNRPPLFKDNNCNNKTKNLPSTIKDKNFSYPITISKNACCDVQQTKPSLNISSTENHTKYLPVMSKIKSYKYRTTDTVDSVKFPNYELVNENNLVGFFNNNIYATSSCCGLSQGSSSSRVGHRTKYSVYDVNTNCKCSDYDEYTLNPTQNVTIPPTKTSSNSSFFSRKWSKFKN